MLFTQGSADTINPPWTSMQLYEADQARARYYLDLLGADHLTPYTGANPVERLVARVTLAFFNRYVLGQAGALAIYSIGIFDPYAPTPEERTGPQLLTTSAPPPAGACSAWTMWTR